MKNYEKPTLTVLSLSGNDQLCGHCADKGGTLLRDNLAVAEEIMSFYEIQDKGSKGPDAQDFIGVFGEGEDCKPHDPPIVGYCKFTSSGTMLVAWS